MGRIYGRRKHCQNSRKTTSEKIVSVPFTSDISEAEKNFDILERGIGKENMGSAHITYIPKPNEILML